MTAVPSAGKARAQALPIRFEVAGRPLWTATRRMRRVQCDLIDLLRGYEPCLPALADDDDGVDLRSAPEAAIDAIRGGSGGLLTMVRQRYRRHYIRLEGTFEDYAQGFSGKSRSTLKRKRKRWVESSGGLDLREYHNSDRIAEFVTVAGTLSERTYQERTLGAGLPVTPASLADMRQRAEQGELRAYILFHQGRPAAYLYLPADNGTLIYAHLGYEPELADLSPGSILQMEALERIFAENSFTMFDFTEGDGSHKRLFGRGSVACADLTLLRPTWRNRLLIGGLTKFNRIVESAGTRADKSGVKPALKRLLRR